MRTILVSLTLLLGVGWSASAQAARRDGPPCLCESAAQATSPATAAMATAPLSASGTAASSPATAAIDPAQRVVTSAGASLWGLRSPGATDVMEPGQDLSALMTGGPGAVRFTLRRPGNVSAGVYDLAGRLVYNFPTLFLGAGQHTLRWGGRISDGDSAPQGMYFVRVRLADGQSSARKVVWTR
jgi:hypothetical protein